MKILIILQGPAYGDERSYNGIRLAANLARRPDVSVRVFCFSDAVGCAVSGQQVPNGFYHLDRMVATTLRHGAEVGLCSTCMDARGLADDNVVEGARRSSLDEAGDWVLWADRTVTF